MSITNELREWANIEVPHKYGHQLTAIADRIDEAHKHAIAYVDDRDQETMAEHGWIRLPLDADGIPIHIGDVMEVINGELKAEACYMQIGPSGIWSVGLTKRCHWYDIESLRHHHEPTVEDVLTKFVTKLIERGELTNGAAQTIAEYATKLRLAKENE